MKAFNHLAHDLAISNTNAHLAYEFESKNSEVITETKKSLADQLCQRSDYLD